MRKSRFTDSQILSMLKQNEQGAPVADICREHAVSSAQFYKWRSKFGGMDVSMMKRLKELEDENRRLKKMYAEEKLKAQIRQEALEGKLQSHWFGKKWLNKQSPSTASVSALTVPV